MRAGRARRLLGLNRRDPERSTMTPEGWQIANIDGRIGDENRTLSRLDKVADQLIADDYQYTSTYRASALQDLLGSYGGRYAEGDSSEWGDNAKRSATTGIHIFKVKIGDNAVEQNSVGETHLVGKHTPIASLVVDSSGNDDNPAREIWKGWLDSVIEQDISKNKGRSGFASRTGVEESTKNQVVPDNERSAARKAKELIENGGSNEDIEAAIREAFTGVVVGMKDYIDNTKTNRGNKFNMRIRSVTVTDEDGRKRISISGQLVSKHLGEYWNGVNEDDIVGSFSRVMYFDENGAEVLHTDVSVPPPVQGFGVGTALNARNEEIYRELGVSTISLYGNSASGRNGASHWPRNGYYWYDENEKNFFLDALSDDLRDTDKETRDRIKALIEKSRADKFGEGVTPEELLAWDDKGKALVGTEIRYRRDIEPSRSGFSSSTQLTPTDDVKEAKRTGRPLSVLRPGTMPPKTQSEYDKIINNLNNAKTEARRINNDRGASGERRKKLDELFSVGGERDLEKYKDLVRAMEKEYGKLGFNKQEVDAIVYAITNHLEKQRQEALVGFQDDFYKDEPWDDAARLQQSVDVLDKADIAVSFPKELLEWLIHDGRFKTQFETNTSRGALFPQARVETDIAQFGYHPDTAPEMRPVFGYLTSGGVMDKKKFASIKIYGELQFVLKRDTHSRSTYATHDTLSSGVTPSPMGVPSANASGSMHTGMYAEAQIHGGLSLSDVDYVTVNVGEPDEWDWQNNKVSEEEFESISGMLTKVGIRVVPVRDGEVLDTWNGGKTIPEPPADIIPEPEPDKRLSKDSLSESPKDGPTDKAAIEATTDEADTAHQHDDDRHHAQAAHAAVDHNQPALRHHHHRCKGQRRSKSQHNAAYHHSRIGLRRNAIEIEREAEAQQGHRHEKQRPVGRPAPLDRP
jgi:hypothetical protein